MRLLARMAWKFALIAAGAGVAVAGPAGAPGATPLTGLELFDQTFGPGTSSCELGIVAVGAPLVITRTSGWVEDDGLLVSDRIVSVNSVPVRDHAGLRNALGSASPDSRVELSVVREDRIASVETDCGDATDILRVREEALLSATESRWNDCIRATYAEEMLWGGPNSLSAGLRLWCHQARRKSHLQSPDAPIGRMDAQLIFEYAQRLLVELGNTSGYEAELQERLRAQAQRFADGGHPELAAELGDLRVAQSAR